MQNPSQPSRKHTKKSVMLDSGLHHRPSQPFSHTWEARAAEKRARCAEAIPNPWHVPPFILDTIQTPLETCKNNLISLDIPRRSGIFDEIELDITESYTVSELLEKLASGIFTAVQVVTAFSKRAALAQQLVRHDSKPSA